MATSKPGMRPAIAKCLEQDQHQQDEMIAIVNTVHVPQQ